MTLYGMVLHTISMVPVHMTPRMHGMVATNSCHTIWHQWLPVPMLCMSQYGMVPMHVVLIHVTVTVAWDQCTYNNSMASMHVTL